MPIMQSPPGVETVIDGRRYLYFSGTGYLGLQGHPDVIRAACEAVKSYGIGSATSRPGFGNMPPTLAVEREAAAFFGTEESFYFVSGYVGTHILAGLFERAFDQVFVDEFSHYSVLEALKLTGLPTCRFRHCDSEDLRGKLKAFLRPGQRPLVVSDGVFPSLGRIAPVREYQDALATYAGSGIHVDDAHAVGVLGENGRGTFEHAGLADAGFNNRVSPDEKPALFATATLSKAIGGFGGILPGSADFLRRTKATSHYYEGCSALPAPVAAATARALQLVRAQPEMRIRLRTNVQRLKDGLRRLGLEVDNTPVPIISLTLRSAEHMQSIQSELMRRGIVITYRASYSGLKAGGALRIAVFATHDATMIDRLLDEMRQIL